jgi:hypothetical protein
MRSVMWEDKVMGLRADTVSWQPRDWHRGASRKRETSIKRTAADAHKPNREHMVSSGEADCRHDSRELTGQWSERSMEDWRVADKCNTLVVKPRQHRSTIPRGLAETRDFNHGRQ